jgi:hypothetical protein
MRSASSLSDAEMSEVLATLTDSGSAHEAGAAAVAMDLDNDHSCNAGDAWRVRDLLAAAALRPSLLLSQDAPHGPRSNDDGVRGSAAVSSMHMHRLRKRHERSPDSDMNQHPRGSLSPAAVQAPKRTRLQRGWAEALLHDNDAADGRRADER